MQYLLCLALSTMHIHISYMHLVTKSHTTPKLNIFEAIPFSFEQSQISAGEMTVVDRGHEERGDSRLMSRNPSVMRFVNEDEIDAKIDQYANEDKSSTKTLTRIFVERFLQDVSSAC